MAPTGLPEKETVGPAEILDKVGTAKEPPLTPIQRAGMYLALGVGLTIALVTTAVILDWFLTRPGLPSLPAGTSSDEAAKIIQNFKELNSVNLERATKLFDLIVAKAFLPVFTGILGYIFGSRTSGGS